MRKFTPLLQLQTLADMSVLVCSVRCDARPEWVATRPWLAFQAKAMVKMVKKIYCANKISDKKLVKLKCNNFFYNFFCHKFFLVREEKKIRSRSEEDKSCSSMASTFQSPFIPFNPFRPPLSTFIHFNPLSSTFIRFHQHSSTFIHFHPLVSVCVHFYPF